MGHPVAFSVAVISLTREGKLWVGPPIGEAASAKRKGLAVVALLLAPAWLALSYSSIPSLSTVNCGGIRWLLRFLKRNGNETTAKRWSQLDYEADLRKVEHSGVNFLGPNVYTP